MEMENRKWRFDVPCTNGFGDCINFKNNSLGIIKIPEGVQVFRIDMIGYSQSTAGNWEYLAAWGSGDKTTPEGGHSGEFEYVADVPWGTKDNDIIKSLEYPISPGAWGGVMGMLLFKHKTRHTLFLICNPLFLLLQFAAGLYLFYKCGISTLSIF